MKIKLPALPSLRKNILIYRWISFNALGVALLFGAWNLGWIEKVLVSDITYITEGIMAAFLFTMVMVGFNIFRLNTDRNQIKEFRLAYQNQVAELGDGARGDIRDAMMTRLENNLSFFPLIATALVTAGIIGTIIGVIIAFGEIPRDLAGDMSQSDNVISRLLSGLNTAFYTTLMGALGSQWIKFNNHMMLSASSDIYSDILAERISS